MRTYNVTISAYAHVEQTVQISAKSRNEAEEIAVESVGNREWEYVDIVDGSVEAHAVLEPEE